jgi:hypothetical protein
MKELILPDTDFTRYDLAEVTRRTRSSVSAGSTGKRLKSWIGLSRVSHIRLREGDLNSDQELLLFLRSDEATGNAYHYVKLGCSFGPEDNEAFERATLGVSLRRMDDGAQPQPVAYSMFPLNAFDPVEVTSTAKLGAAFQLFSSELSGSEKRKHKEPFITAYREGESEPFWEFTATESTPLAGSYRLHMIVRTPLGVGVEGRIELAPFVAYRRFMLIPTTAPLEDTPEQLFRLQS